MVSDLLLPNAGHQAHLLELGLRVGHDDECLVAGPIPMGFGWAQPEKVTWSSLLVGSPLAGRAKRVSVV